MTPPPSASKLWTPRKYLILSVLHSDEFTKKVVWMKEGGGFTADFTRAGEFLQAEAAKIQGDCSQFVMVDPCAEELTEFHFHVEIHLDSPAQSGLFAELVGNARKAITTA